MERDPFGLDQTAWMMTRSHSNLAYVLFARSDPDRVGHVLAGLGMNDITTALRAEARNTPVSGIIEAVNHGREKEGLIPLWVGEGDLPTPAFIADAATKGLADGETFYTYQRGLPEMRQALANYYGRLYGGTFDPDRFFLTGSGMQAIQISLNAVVGKDEELLIPTPSWPNVDGAAAVLGAGRVPIPMREENGRWYLGVDQLEAALTPKTRAIFVNSPANPTGWVADLQTLKDILALARRHGLWIIADEIYARFIWTGAARAPSFFDFCDPADKIIFVNTFSKNWAMTGWRMGWIYAPEGMRQTLESLIQYSTSGVAAFMQRAGIAALNEGDWFIDHMVERARRGRAVLVDALSGRNSVTFAPPDGAFYAFIKVDGIDSSREAAIRIIDEANVGTAPGTAFGSVGEGFVRICFARSEASLTEAMDRFTRWIER